MYYQCLSMSNPDVKTLLFVNSSKIQYSFSLLFHCATYWAQQGNRVLFISKTPEKNFPLKIGNLDLQPSPDIFKLIQFMYLPSWQDLLRQLYSMHIRYHAISTIIVKNLDSYLKMDSENENYASLICASLLQAAVTCSKRTLKPSVLITQLCCEDSTIERNILKNFFHNVWEIKILKEIPDKSSVKLVKLSPSLNNEVNLYTLQENSARSSLEFTDILKKIINSSISEKNIFD